MSKRDDQQDTRLAVGMQLDMLNMGVNASQAQEIALHKKHIQALWHHIERLERYIEATSDGLRIKVDRSEILIRKNGVILIDGQLITLKVPNNTKMITSAGDM